MDRIKVYIENFISTTYKEWKYRGEGKYPGQKIYTLKIYNPNALKKHYAIKLFKFVNEDTGVEFIKFNNSIRKWYFGSNTRQNLNWSQYTDCIKLLSKEIGVREIDMWTARVVNLEIGINLVLDKNLKDINDCLVRYRNLEREEFKTTVYFQGQNFKIKIYDKWAEIFKSKKMNVYQKRFADNFHLLRVEVVVNKMSGYYKQKAATLGDIRDNWNELIKRLLWYVKGIDFVDRISPAIDERSIKTVTDFYGYHLYKRINEDFFKNLAKFENLNFTKNNKPDNIGKFFSSFERGISKKNDFKEEFYSVLDKKAVTLYNKGNI